MSLSSSIASHTRRPTARVYLDGRRCKLRDVSGAITVSQTFGQPISGGVVQIIDPPTTPTIGMSIKWDWGYNGHNIAGFNGVVKKARRSAYPQGWILDVVDPLWKADINKEDINLLNDKTAKEVVTTLLKDYGGVTRLDIARLPASGSAWSGGEWMLGTLTPIAFSGTTALQAASSICAVLGYWLFCDASGTARAVFMDGRPSASAFRTFTQGVDLLVEGAPEREQDADAIYNRVIVLGANTGVEGAQIKDQWQTEHVLLPSGRYREFNFSSSLIEYVNESEAGAASATAVAKRILAVKARQPNAIRARIKADPRLQVGMTLGIQSSRIGYGGRTNFFLYSVQTTFGGGQFDQQIVLDGGLGDQGYTTIPPPLAAFTYTLFRETLNGVDTIEVFVDGSASTSLTNGEIVSYAWSDDSTPVQTGTGVRFVFFYPASQVTAEITLTVTDTSSKTGSTTQTIALTGDALQVPEKRQISFAAGAAWYVTPDSGATWNKETSQGDAIATPPIGSGAAADTGTSVDASTAVGMYATAGSGGARVRTTTDFLLSGSTQLATLPGPVHFLWQNETDPTRLWAAVGDDVYRSIDGGTTFTLAGTPASGQDVAWVLESADQVSVEALAGSNAYWSYSGGASWALVLTGPAGSVARCYASGFATHWVGFTGVASGLSPLMSVEGITATFPAVTPEVLDIRALTMLVDQPILYAWDDQGRTWKVDAATGAVTAMTATTGTIPDTTPQHAIRDPSAPLIYVSCNDALRKYFPDPDVLKLFKSVITVSEQGHMAGYANIRQRVGVEVVIPPFGASGVGDVVLHYVGSDWLKKTPPIAGLYWLDIAANPFNPDEWLMLGNTVPNSDDFISAGGFITTRDDGHDPLWHTTDAGLTWTAIPLEDPGGVTTGGIQRLGQPTWREDFGGQWLLTGRRIYSFVPYAVVWRGLNASATSVTQYTNGSNNDIRPAIGGFNGDIVTGVGEGSAVFAIIPPTGSSYVTHPLSTSPIVFKWRIDRWPLTERGIIAVDNDAGLHWAPDYSGGTLPLVLAGTGFICSTFANGDVLIGSRTGVGLVTNISSSPTLTVVAAAGLPAGNVRTDRQTRTAAAAFNPSEGLVRVFDGTTWASLALPLGNTPSTAVEVLVRS